jgi:hypothetical protein
LNDFSGRNLHVDSSAAALKRLKNKSNFEVPLRIAGH